MGSMVDINNLTKHFGPLVAVDHISFTVAKGEVLGFLGPNGAGKSTTMKMITGFLTPNEGTVSIDGIDLATNPIAAKRKIGYLPEGAPAYQDMTPQRFLEFIADIRGIPEDEKNKRIRDTVAKINLESVLHQPIETLSKGFKRRVGLAQAIIHDPEVLILDEPTDGLDPNQKHEVRNLILTMAKDKAIILSTHILEEVQAVCSRAIIIASGKILADGAPNVLQSQSRLHNAVILSVDTKLADTAKQALEKLSNVASVEIHALNEHSKQLTVFPKDKKSIITDISHLVHDKNWEVGELHIEKGHLDDVFRTITQSQQAIS